MHVDPLWSQVVRCGLVGPDSEVCHHVSIQAADSTGAWGKGLAEDAEICLMHRRTDLYQRKT